MAVNKFNGFAAPYRGDTFRKIANTQAGRNGVLSMDGEVTQAGATITVPALTFIQDGMIVEKTEATTLSAPTMPAPYSLVVTAPTPQLLDDLIWTFVKSPLDFTPNLTPVASYDGLEWREPVRLSADGIHDEINQSNMDFDKVGPFSGLLTTLDGVYKNSPGVIVDKSGLRQKLTAEALFPVVAADPDWARVDRVIYRRPLDSEQRLGVRALLTGGAFAAAPATLYDSESFDDSVARDRTKVLVDQDNIAHILVAAGSGDVWEIRYTKVSDDRQTVLIPETALAYGTEAAFDAVLDSDNNLYLVYVDGGDIKWQSFDSGGSPLTAATTIDAQGTPCAAPRIAIDPFDARTYVVFQSLVGASNNQIFFASVELGGTIATAATRLTNNGSDLEAPSIFVTDDYLVYVAWQDTTAGTVSLQAFDDIGGEISAPVVVSGDTTRVGFGPVTGTAKAPRVFVTGDKIPGVAFLQDKGGSLWGVTVWKSGAGEMVDMSGAGEDIEVFDLAVDPIFNTPLVLFATASEVWAAKIKDSAVSFSQLIAATGARSVSTVRDICGAMLHAWSTPASLTMAPVLSNETIFYLGSQIVTGSVNNATLAGTEFMISSAVSEEPRVGDEVVVAGSPNPGNNLTAFVTAVRLHSLNALDDRLIVTTDATFPVTESPSLGSAATFSRPTGNAARFIKATSELQAQAYSFEELASDILLTRIVMPGSTILNYPGGGAGGGSAQNYLLPYGPAVQIDWGKTAAGVLTIAGGLKVLDLLNNFTYALADGGYALGEDEALYVELDGANFTPTPQTALIQNLPFGQPIQVLGVIKDGEFHAHLLGAGGFGQLDAGEGIAFGEDIPGDTRARLGITSETTFEAYSSQIGIGGAGVTLPTAISQTNIMAGQNKHIRLVRGQWSWVKPGASELVVLTESFLQVPGAAEARNRIAPQTISLTADGQVAHVEVNRLPGVAADLAVSVSPIASLSLTRDTIILARRVGTDVVLEANGGTLLEPGSTIDIGQSVTEENRELLGLTAASKNGGAFTTALGPTTDNKVVADGDTFEEALKKLDGRDDTVRKVRLIDLVSTSLPAGATATIDAVSVANGDKVLFPNLGSNPGVYVAAGVGVALAWTQLTEFGNSSSPAARSLVAVREGTQYLRTVWQYDTSEGWKPLELASAVKEPTGFPNRTDSAISFNDGTRTFMVAVAGAHFDYMIKGKVFRKDTAQSVVIPDTEGLHYVYFDGETLSSTMAFTDDLLKEYAYVATVYWDADNSVALMVGDERHGAVMDAETHKYLHQTNGTQVRGGLSAGDLTTVGTGAADADAQLSLSDGYVIDEDLQHEVTHAAVPTADFEQILDPLAELPVFYRSGASGVWRKDAATTFPVKQGTARIKWNNPAGPWTTPDATLDGNFVAMWVFATSSIEEPIIAILGQNEWATLSDAQQGETYETILLGELPAAEMKVLYRLIFETDSAFANTPKAALRDVRDLRTTIDTGLPAYAPADHGLLTGLNDQDHAASAIYTDTAGFLGALSPADDDVQKALDTLDRYFRTLQLSPHPSNGNRVVLSGASADKTTAAELAQVLDGLLVDFLGAEIDFSTGQIFKSDGTTPLGVDFTPATIASGQWRWYAVSLIPDAATAENRISVKVQVQVAGSDGATQALAPRATFSGDTAIGQVAVQEAGGGIAAIDYDNIAQLGVGAGGGGGAVKDFKISLVSGNLATIKGGQLVVGDDTLMTYDGAGTDAADFGKDLIINLDTILGSGPAASTTYFLFIDLWTIASSPTTLGSSGDVVYGVQEGNFKLFTARSQDSNRYVYVGFTRSTAGGTWSGVGAAFGTRGVKTHDKLARAWNYPQEMPVQAITVAAATNTINHGLSGKPQHVEVRYFDGTTERGLDYQSHVLDVTATQIKVSSFGPTLGGGQEIRVYATHFPNQPGLIFPANSKMLGPYTAAGPASEVHTLSDPGPFASISVIEHDLVAGTYRPVPSSTMVKWWDKTSIFYDWVGVPFTVGGNAAAYYIFMGPSPAAMAIPSYLTGFTKAVGVGPGSYATLSAALTAAVPGDRILVMRSTIEPAGDLNANVPNVTVRCMPGAVIGLNGALTNGLRLTAARVRFEALLLGLSPSGTQARGVSIEAAGAKVEGEVELLTAQTVTDLLHVTAGGVRAKADLSVLKTAGTITNLETSNGGAGNTFVYGG